MSMFEHRKMAQERPDRNPLMTLRETLKKLEDETAETERIVDLKRILANRIAELERKTARI